MKILSISAALLLLGFVASPQAQPPADGTVFLPTPELPTSAPGLRSGEILEPEVTIIETESQVITEYRIRGRLYMVKIDPRTGPPYFLFDSNGDGQLDAQRGTADNLSIHQWQLFSW